MNTRLLTIATKELLGSARLIIAGYTGSDSESLANHISELERLGVPAPKATPEFYIVDPSLISDGETIAVSGDSTSGEVEPVLIRHQGEYFLSVGSDHTDREVERESVLASKEVCPKPISSTALHVTVEELDEYWDGIEVRSWVDGSLYQQGNLAHLLPLPVILRIAQERGLVNEVEDFIMFGGTLPLLDGTFRFDSTWDCELVFKGRVLQLRYSVERKDSL